MKELSYIKKSKWIILSILLLALFFTSSTSLQAATIYLDPGAGTVSESDTFVVSIRIDNEGECINAAQVVLDYPQEFIQAVDVGTGSSIFTLWPEGPEINEREGLVTFTGGLPGGYCGRIPGDPGLTNVLAKVAFQPPAQDVDRILTDSVTLSFLEGTRVFLNDGRGSQAELNTIGAEFNVGEESSFDAGEWLTSIQEDVTPPASFEIHLVKDESVFRGRYFIVFSTTDKGSGISHYEVRESDIDNEGFVRGSNDRAVFKRAKSPYLLEDQTLNSVVTVRAVDKAGNETVSRFVPDESMRYSQGLPLWATFLLVVLVLAFLIAATVFVRSRKKRTGDENGVNNQDVLNN